MILNIMLVLIVLFFVLIWVFFISVELASMDRSILMKVNILKRKIRGKMMTLCVHVDFNPDRPISVHPQQVPCHGKIQGVCELLSPES